MLRPMNTKRFVIFGLILFFGFVGAVAVTLGLIFNAQQLQPTRLEPSGRVLQIYDNNDNLIKDSSHYRSVKLDKLPHHTPGAFIAVEDKDFRKHHGITPGRIVKATVKNARSGYAKEGASTISQQLIKNTHLSHEKTIQRKLREASLAIKLERKYKKDEILEMYLNAIYFGNGIYGLENAAQFYYSKPATDLTLRESAALAGLLRNPSRFCPINNPERFNDRAALVLSLMHNQKRITREQYNDAKNEKLEIKPDRGRIQSKAGHYRNAAAAEAAKILDISPSDLAAFGYRIYTFYDDDIQDVVTKTITAPAYAIGTTSGGQADSVVIHATPNGEINSYFASNPTLFGARRNFASAMKPLVVYAPAIEHGTVAPATHINDEPYTCGDFSPKNYDGTYRGMVSVRQSLAKSHNIPAAKVMDYTGLKNCTEFGRKLGLRLEDENASLALGNTNKGTGFGELLAGYCALANGGTAVNPSFIKRIENRDGRIVHQHKRHIHRAMGADTAYLVTDMLCTAVTDGTAKKLSSLEFPVAAKTGTAERTGSVNNTDAVIAAYTPDRVLIVWRGNTDMRPENDLIKGGTGGGVTAFAARDILRNTHKKFTADKWAGDSQKSSTLARTDSSFQRPASVIELEYDLTDARAGILSLAHHDTPVKERGTEVFSLRHAPKDTSPNHRTVTPTTLDGKIGDTGTPMIWFPTLPTQSYEIYRIDGTNKTLQEVIAGNGGEYIYFDKNPTPGKATEYQVTSKIMSSADAMNPDNDLVPVYPKEEAQSNTVKLIPPSESNPDSKAIAAKKPSSGRQWFF